MKTKLSPLQKYKLSLALNAASSVLREIKQKPLTGKALDEMKLLEISVQNLEFFDMR